MSKVYSVRIKLPYGDAKFFNKNKQTNKEKIVELNKERKHQYLFT